MCVCAMQVQPSWGNVTLVIAGLTNTYSSYVTTYEEYQAQRYEGASTIFGPHTLDAYIQVMLHQSMSSLVWIRHILLSSERQEKTTPFGGILMRSHITYWAAQVILSLHIHQNHVSPRLRCIQSSVAFCANSCFLSHQQELLTLLPGGLSKATHVRLQFCMLTCKKPHVLQVSHLL